MTMTMTIWVYQSQSCDIVWHVYVWGWKHARRWRVGTPAGSAGSRIRRRPDPPAASSGSIIGSCVPAFTLPVRIFSAGTQTFRVAGVWILSTDFSGGRGLDFIHVNCWVVSNNLIEKWMDDLQKIGDLQAGILNFVWFFDRNVRRTICRKLAILKGEHWVRFYFLIK